MAPEIVPNEPERGPAAFSCFDSSVFSSWAEAVSDLLACGDEDQMAHGTIANAGGLIYSLTQAVWELRDAEEAGRRAQP